MKRIKFSTVDWIRAFDVIISKIMCIKLININKNCSKSIFIIIFKWSSFEIVVYFFICRQWRHIFIDRWWNNLNDVQFHIEMKFFWFCVSLFDWVTFWCVKCDKFDFVVIWIPFFLFFSWFKHRISVEWPSNKFSNKNEKLKNYYF